MAPNINKLAPIQNVAPKFNKMAPIQNVASKTNKMAHGQKCFPLEVFDDKDNIFRNVDDKADRGWQFIQVESVNGSNEDELRAGRSMQGHRKGEVQIQ